MKIPITQNQFDYLSRRNAALLQANMALRAAQAVVQESNAALMESLICIKLDAGHKELEFEGWRISSEKDGFVLDLTEALKPAENTSPKASSEPQVP